MTENEAIKELEMYINPSPVAKAVAVEALKEIQQYRSIGTVEACGEAFKEKPRRLIPSNDGNYNAVCPTCGCIFPASVFLSYAEQLPARCDKCGQKIDWTENERTETQACV